MKKDIFLYRINDFLYKPIFFQDINKREGFLSIIFICVYVVGFVFVVMSTDKEKIYVVGTIFDFLVCLFLIILNRKKLYTLGFRKIKWKETIMIFISFLVVALLANINRINSNEVTIYDFVFNVLFYLIAVGFSEEFIFRGYLWPRLVVLCGKHMGTLISGILFGVTHLISTSKYGDTHIDFLIITNTISSGIVAQYCFLFLYAYAQNIYFLSILHAAPHFFTVRRTVKNLFDILKEFI